MGKEQMHTDLISVIIPCYNVEQYIDRCMESVLNQTYQNLEIILVDDGSTDSTSAICDKYSAIDQRVQVIHKKNGGLSSARNAGMNTATGTYIGFVDSDDWIDWDFYFYLYNLIIQYDVDMAWCGYCLTDGLRENVTVREQIKKVNNSDLMDVFFRTKGGDSNSSVWNRLYKQEIIKGITFPDGYVNEDVYFSYFAFTRTSCAVISNLPKYYYYINEQGITRGALRKQDISLYYVWDKVIEDTQKHNRQYYENAVLNRNRAVFTLLSKYVIYGIKDENIFTDQWVHEETKELRKAYRDLMRSKTLDTKRKFILSLLCLSPKMLQYICMKLRKSKVRIK